MFDIIKDVIYEVTGKVNITEDTDYIKDLELNSFDMINIVCMFEEKFNIKLQTRDVWKLHTVRDTIEYLSKIKKA